MKIVPGHIVAAFIVFASTITMAYRTADVSSGEFPYRQAGLTDTQAAAHLVSRFTYGTRPGSVEQVLKLGLTKWFYQQLEGTLPDSQLQEHLRNYDALNLTNQQVVALYPRPSQILQNAVKEGVISKDSIGLAGKAAYKTVLLNYMQNKGLRSRKDLFRQFVNQKVLRAAYSNNQLHEVLTEFWMNHFNVSVTKNICADFIPAYERDVIRPRVTGSFRDLLLATAKSPAMLFYLDNFSSSGVNTGMPGHLVDDSLMPARLQQRKDKRGLNENYARELMELHTLGVDGGYSQQDVTEAARVLTGWTIFPFASYGAAGTAKKIIDGLGEEGLEKRGFVHDGDFLFAANRHDNTPKKVLGQSFFNPGHGYQEGVELLNLLARHPSTAKFIARKIAVRFVSDNPPATLINKLAKTYTDTDGDIKKVLIALVYAPEFWSKDAVREKTKSPFELAISAVRGLNAEIDKPYQLYNWAAKMGQKLYACQPPTGFPDQGQFWINSGALLSRMNFGIALAAGRIPGVNINLLALNNGHEPESAEAALKVYASLLLPARNLSQTFKRLTPLLYNPELDKKLELAAAKLPAGQPVSPDEDDLELTPGEEGTRVQRPPGNKELLTASQMMQVIGIIIGSPEFQRR